MNARTLSGVALAGLLGASAAWAFNFNESTDAGFTMATATVLPQGTTAVTGTIVNTTESDVDLFRFSLDAETAFTIDVLSSDFDANLILFNGNGQGLAGDDDGGLGLDSRLTLTLAAGTYFFAVGGNNMGAFASQADYEAATDFIDNDSGILGSPTVETLGRVGAESGPTDINGQGAYSVTFSDPVSGPAATAVPTLPIWLLGMLGGLLAFVGTRQLRRSS